MADTFETIAARCMPAVQDAYAGTLYGYAAELGYGAAEYDCAVSAAERAVRKIIDRSKREDILQLARLIAAKLLADGSHTPEHAGRAAVNRAWLTEAPSHGAGVSVDAMPADPITLTATADTSWSNAHVPATDDAYVTRTRDLIGYALQSLTARDLALVTACSAVDAHQSSRLPVAAIVRHLMAYAPHVAADLGLTDGLPTGRRAMAFGAHVRDALQAFGDAYADTLHHDTHDTRRRCSRPAPTLYVLPERAGYATRTPDGSGYVQHVQRVTPTRRVTLYRHLAPMLAGYAAITDGWPIAGRVALECVSLVKVPAPIVRRGPVGHDGTPARVAGTMAPEWRATGVREQRAADHAAFSDTLSSAARPVPGVRPGTRVGNVIAGEGTALRVQASRKRKRDGGIGSPMTRA